MEIEHPDLVQERDEALAKVRMLEDCCFLDLRCLNGIALLRHL